MGQKPIFDHSLYFRAQTDANGANVHLIKSLVQCYVGFWECGQLHGWTAKGRQRFEQSERELRTVVAGGRRSSVPGGGS